MVELIVWVVFGGIVGWIASMIMGTNAQQGAIANVIIGIVGALIGGYLSRALGGPGVSGFNIASLFVSVLGAVILIAVMRLFMRGGQSTY